MIHVCAVTVVERGESIKVMGVVELVLASYLLGKGSRHYVKTYVDRSDGEVAISVSNCTGERFSVVIVHTYRISLISTHGYYLFHFVNTHG